MTSTATTLPTVTATTTASVPLRAMTTATPMQRPILSAIAPLQADLAPSVSVKVVTIAKTTALT